MLVYDNRERWRILLQIEGGVLWKNLPRSILIGLLTLGVAVWIRFGAESFWKPYITHKWAGQILGGSISFAVVYRTRMAWSRYWEAATQVHFMFSKWSDCFTQAMSFISTAEKRLAKSGATGPEAEAAMKALQKARNNIAHDFSLISALATHRLTHGDIHRLQRRTDVYVRGGCFFWRPCMLARYWNELIVSAEQLRYVDLEKVFRLPHFRVIDLGNRRTQVKARMQHHLTNNHTGASVRLPSYVQSRSEEDMPSIVLTSSNVTWSSDLVILGALSYDEKTALDDIYDPGSMTTQPDRVHLLTQWINEDINELVPLVGIPPPIMSRCYQELSNGMLGFNQATKMADIPFPFPFLQLMELLLVCYSALLPIYAAQFTSGLFLSPCLATIVSLSFWSLSEISRELETPFADGPNQLPVIDMHERFVEVLRSIFLSRRPTDEPPATSATGDASDGEDVEEQDEISTDSHQEPKKAL